MHGMHTNKRCTEKKNLHLKKVCMYCTYIQKRNNNKKALFLLGCSWLLCSHSIINIGYQSQYSLRCVSGAERWIAYIQWFWSIYYVFLWKHLWSRASPAAFPARARVLSMKQWCWNYCATRMSAKGLQALSAFKTPCKALGDLQCEFDSDWVKVRPGFSCGQ